MISLSVEVSSISVDEHNYHSVATIVVRRAITDHCTSVSCDFLRLLCGLQGSEIMINSKQSGHCTFISTDSYDTERIILFLEMHF